VLGVEPLMGRTFTEHDDSTGADVVIISHDLWRRRYGRDASIIGRTMLMDDKRYDVIGVMPQSFVFRRNDIDYWIPTHFTPSEAADRRSHYLNVVARLKPGVSIDAANAEMRRISTVLQREYPETNGNAHVTTTVVPLKADLLGNTRVELLVLVGAAAAVLLIACANLASLLLSRGIDRRGELAVRVALGATRARLVRQMLIEAVTLSIAGGLLALVIAPAGISLIAQLVPDGVPSVPASVLDLRLLSFTSAVALLAAVVFSVVPAWQTTRVFGSGGLRQGTRLLVGPDTGRTRDTLIVLQIAAALMLLGGSGLMLRTIANFRAIDLGFRPDHLLTLRTPLPRARYSAPVQRLRFYNEVIVRIRELAGVEDAAYASTVPFTNAGNTSWYQIEGVTLDSDDPADTLRRVGTSDYLKTLGVTLVEGRLLDRRDDTGAPLAVVINDTMARRYWPDDTAIGRRIRFGPSDPFYTIVGVVQDVRERGYELAMKPAVYLPAAQWRVESTDNLVVRVVGNPLDYANAIRRVIASVNPDQAVAAVRTMDEILDRDLGNRQQQTILMAAFAAIALMLAMVGVYGVISYSVAQRSREFGVRIALGASPGSVIRVVAARGLSLTVLGLSIGLALAWTTARTMKSLLYGVTSTDPTTFTAVVLLLGCTGMIASYLPARRATCVDVMEILRHE
jgi:putative ABC transport system permease protein